MLEDVFDDKLSLPVIHLLFVFLGHNIILLYITK